ncbi:hypothetical protein D3C84_332580 [compost metagenome]
MLPLDPEEHGRGTRHIDGGVGPEGHPYHHGDGKTVDQRAALEQQRHHHHEGQPRGDDGPAQGLGHGEIHDLGGIPLAHLAEVLPQAVEHHYGVVQGVAHQGHQRRQHGQVELVLEVGEDAEGDDDVVRQGEDAPHGQTPFEPHRHVGQDTEDGGQHGQGTVCRQLVTHRRTDELDALEHGALVDQLGSRQHLVALLLDLDPLLGGHAHQHVAAGAEELQGRPFNLLLIQRFVHLVQAHRLLEPHLYGGAPGKVQPPVQAAIEQAEQGEHRQQGREHHSRLGETHEGDGLFKM